MAEVDYIIAHWISSHLPYILAGLILVWVIKVKGADLRKRWFSSVMVFFSKHSDPKSVELKKDFFSSLSSITSHDPKLRKEKKIKILEVGVGTGVNFQFYPDGCHLMVVDPNPYFAKYYNDNRKDFPNICSEELYITTGEEMTDVADSSVDVVVMTLVLCSVSDPDKVLRQVLRVLVPGGKFYAMEHIKEFDPSKHWVRSILQECLTVTGISCFLFDGCCFNRDVLPNIERAGFSKVEGERYYAPMAKLLVWLVKPHLKVIAVK